MAAKLKIVDHTLADTAPPPTPPDFTPAPTRNRHAGWTAERQRKFIEHLALTGMVGEASALVGFASSSAYRLRDRAGAESFAHAWDAALHLTPTRLSAITFDRAVNGRVERFYKNGELVMERRIPSDHLLTWLLSRLDPLRFGSARRQGPRRHHGRPARGRAPRHARTARQLGRRVPRGLPAGRHRLPRRPARGDRQRRTDRRS